MVREGRKRLGGREGEGRQGKDVMGKKGRERREEGRDWIYLIVMVGEAKAGREGGRRGKGGRKGKGEKSRREERKGE